MDGMANAESKYCADTIWRISFQNAMYPFLEHKIISCKLFNVSNVAQVSDIIAKYSRESNNFTLYNNIMRFILVPPIIL